MKNIVIKWAVFLTAFLISLEVSAQNVRVSGVVTDALGPIPGVNIMEEGTTNGTVTDVNGNYWLSSTAVGMEKAQTELSSHGITPTWLEDLSQYYGEYETNTGSVRIWLEEEKSVQAKLDFMKTAGIGGVACWKLGLEKDSVWTEIADYVGTAKQ